MLGDERACLLASGAWLSEVTQVLRDLPALLVHRHAPEAAGAVGGTDQGPGHHTREAHLLAQLLELDELVQYLQGVGNPGVAGDTTAALVGSVYTDNTTGAIWTKHTAGTGTDKWSRLASETYVNNAVGATISWREPVI